MHTYKLPAFLFAIVLGLSFSACLTKEEQSARARVKVVEAAYEEAKPAIDAFFKATTDLYGAVSLKIPAGSFAGATAADTTVFHEMEVTYTSFFDPKGSLVSLSPAIKIPENALPVFLDPTQKPEGPAWMVQHIKYADHEHLGFFLDRETEGKWHFTLSDPSDYVPEESRQEVADSILGSIKAQLNMKYLLGLEELILIPGKMIDDKHYESGKLLVKVHVWDIQAKKEVASFYASGKNSYMTFTFTDNKESQEKELISDLRNSICVELMKNY